jgi:predicted phosphodiesterase
MGRSFAHSKAALGVAATASILAVGVALSGCSKSSSRKGGAASTSAPTTTSSSATPTGTQPSGPAASSGAEVTSLVVPTALASGSIPVAFRVADSASTSVPVEVVFSVDGGQTFKPVSGAPSQALATGPAPGVEHSFTWDTMVDVPGFETVILEVRPQPGVELQATLVVDNQALSTAVTLSRQPYLQSTNQTQTYVRWRTVTATDSVVEFGETLALGRTATASSTTPANAHEVLLTGLSAGTRYHYRIVSGGLPVTPRFSFRTAPDSSVRDFSFLVVGDSGMNNQDQLDVANRMAQEDADLLIHTGDVIYPAGGLGAAVQEYDLRFFKPYETLLSRMPAFPVVGNHDLYGLFGQPFRKAFTLPPNGNSLLEELYYSFEWGDAKFIALEGNTAFQFLSIGPHMDWLRRELSQNTRKWLFVYMHPPVYSAGKHGDNSRLESTLEPLFEAYGVDLVICGHDHNYERTKPMKAFNQSPGFPGLVHIVTGGGGAALRPVNATPNTAVAISVHHYMKFKVQGDWVHAEAIDSQGNLVERFSVQEH